MSELYKRAPLSEKELAMREALPRAARPKKAATIILWHGPRDNPRILMGKRAKRHDFMPSVYVFPGGRVDRGDSYASYEGSLSPRTDRILSAAYAPRQARAIILTAIRETYEETGLMIGREAPQLRNPKHESWQAFYEAGLSADISGIEVIGRAVTPPRRHKRFDTWFFEKEVSEDIIGAASDSMELEDVRWMTFAEIAECPLHTATNSMLDVMRDHLARDNPAREILYMRNELSGYVVGSFPLGGKI